MTTTYQVNGKDDLTGHIVSSTNHLTPGSALRQMAKLKKHPRVTDIEVLDYSTEVVLGGVSFKGSGIWGRV